MKTQSYKLAGDTVQIRFVESAADADEAVRWCASQRLLATDTEGTGLDQYAPGFRVRLAQFGSASASYVLPVDQFRAATIDILKHPRQLGINVPFDAISLHVAQLADAFDLQARTVDVGLISRLIDPRRKGEGGAIGNRQEELAAAYVDECVYELEDSLHAEFKRLGFLRSEGYARIPLDNPVYQLYSGMDPILLSRVFPILYKELKALPSYGLLQFEKNVQRVCMRMEMRGLRVDRAYAEKLGAELEAERVENVEKAARYGVVNVNSTKQVAEALVGAGEELTKTTASGALQVDKTVLAVLADVNVRTWERIGAREPNPLADAAMHAKRASKWKTAFVEPMLNDLGIDGRRHIKINSLAARTSRQSITGGLHQLPSSDNRVRGMVIAEEGHVFIASDYSSMEMRVLAGLADVAVLKQAVIDKRDLHCSIAAYIHGADFEDRWRQGDPDAVRIRGSIKVAGLATIFGGGKNAIATQTGMSLGDAAQIQTDFFTACPEVRKYGNSLQREAMSNGGHIVSATGRVLPCDRDRTYALTNYSIQSVSADIFKDAGLRIEAAGMGAQLVLPFHDEYIAESKEEDAEADAAKLAGLMTTELFGVALDAEAKVIGKRWKKV